MQALRIDPRFATATLTIAIVLLLAVGAAGASDQRGRLYGKVTTAKGDSFTGVLRWDDQEAFWDDHFNSGKTELPYVEEFADERRRSNLEILGRAFGLKWKGSGGRQFVTRFGDIARIEVRGHARARLVMKDGTELNVEGSADDVEATIQVHDAAVGQVKIPWAKVATVEFMATPKDAVADGFRLRGTVTTTSRTFEGYIQWDSQECLSYDELDGDNDDIRMSIEMGKIRSIARHSRSSAEVVLKDGRKMVLDGTNDVNSDIRGIMVDDARYGRVKISWDAFRRVEFADAGPSGRPYTDYKPLGELRGRVTTSGGGNQSGRLVFDLDEAYGWEILDGDADNVSYSIPFAMIASITPRGTRAALVKLRGGEELRLEETQDVSDDNDGVLVLGAEKPYYASWGEIERIDFD